MQKSSPGAWHGRPAREEFGSSTDPIALLEAHFPSLARCVDVRSFFGNWKFRFLCDLLSGVCVACFLSWAAGRSVREHARVDARRSFVLSLLSSKFAVGLGAFSYSLYPTHAPVEALLERLFSKPALGPNVRAFSFVIAATAASVAFGYLFHLVLEKPFMKRRGT
jgi:peptidoglycan/LPS O-acetylase OafA/YrhL